jgi:hypothetical protein
VYPCVKWCEKMITHRSEPLTKMFSAHVFEELCLCYIQTSQCDLTLTKMIIWETVFFLSTKCRKTVESFICPLTTLNFLIL